MTTKNRFLSRLKRRPFWLFLIGIALCEAFSSSPSPAAPQGGVIKQARGTVSIRRGPQGAWERLPVPRGRAVRPGDALRTGADSWVVLLTGEGKILLGPGSEMELVARKRRPAWRLLIGRIANFLYGQPQSDTEAGHVIAAAAGTHYHLSLAGDGTGTLIVLSGAVDFGTTREAGGPGAAVRVTAGFESSALPGQPPRPPAATDISRAIAWEAEMDALSLPIEYPTARPEGDLAALLSSGQPVDWLKAGDILLAQRQPEKAEEQYRRARKAMPDAAWARTAFAHLVAGEAADAGEAAARALSAAPADPEAIAASGAALLVQRKTGDALRLLEQASAAGQPEAMLYAGLAYLRRGDLGKANR